MWQDTGFRTLLAQTTATFPLGVSFRRSTGRQPKNQTAIPVANLPDTTKAPTGQVLVLEEAGSDDFRS